METLSLASFGDSRQFNGLSGMSIGMNGFREGHLASGNPTSRACLRPCKPSLLPISMWDYWFSMPLYPGLEPDRNSAGLHLRRGTMES
eukprot:scaffold1141_cov333-Pavlova_lutheri.AAC.1